MHFTVLGPQAPEQRGIFLHCRSIVHCDATVSCWVCEKLEMPTCHPHGNPGMYIPCKLWMEFNSLLSSF